MEHGDVGTGQHDAGFGQYQPLDEERPTRVLMRAIYAVLGFIALICLYFLSLGPIMKYSAQTVLMPFPSGSAKTIMLKASRSPGWVTSLYAPAFKILGPDLRPEYGKHDLLNNYKRYLQRWTP